MTSGPTASTGSLVGKRVLVTRERPGELAALLAERGADVVHVPLIATVEPADGGTALRSALDDLESYDWLVVTSAAGAERVGAAAGAHRSVRLAAVGSATARVLCELSDRSVDVQPDQQIASELGGAIIAAAGLPPARILLAQAGRAGNTLRDMLLDAGHDVTNVVAYETVALSPDLDLVRGANALVLASGSAAQSWVESVGVSGPDVIVAIGPTTASVAEKLGLKVTGVAADHSLVGLADELERHFPSSAT